MCGCHRSAGIFCDQHKTPWNRRFEADAPKMTYVTASIRPVPVGAYIALIREGKD
jgi:hypothetical protein